MCQQYRKECSSTSSNIIFVLGERFTQNLHKKKEISKIKITPKILGNKIIKQINIIKKLKLLLLIYNYSSKQKPLHKLFF